MNKSNSSSKESIKYFTRYEVSEHSSFGDVWMIIHDNVYDLTSFLDIHPGGMDILLEYAGTDASLSFNDVGHSSHAKAMLQKYKIGELAGRKHSEEHATNENIYEHQTTALKTINNVEQGCRNNLRDNNHITEFNN
uniref:Cytochrome b5 heme-binding domain-containing protein n=1 Tax=Parastrongyloides trichosuri TaxID=131310 RepID=A0A0N4Z8S1_PARTI